MADFSAWGYYTEMTVNSIKVDETVAGWTCVFDLSGLDATFWANVDTNGDDLRGAETDGTTQIPIHVIEIDTIAKTGTCAVKFGINASTNQTFRIYFGNGAASPLSKSDTNGEYATWSTLYDWVYTLNEDPASQATIYNSVANADNLSANDTAGPVQDTSGHLESNAQDFESTQADFLEASVTGTHDLVAPLTLLTLANSEALSAANHTIFSKYTPTSNNRGYVWYFTNDSIRFLKYPNGSTAHLHTSSVVARVAGDIGNWRHYAYTLDSAGTSSKHYKSGFQLGTTGSVTNATIYDPSAYVGIGAVERSSVSPDLPFDGKLQLVRIVSGTEWSANRIATDYNMLFDAGFYTYGASVSNGGTSYTLDCDAGSFALTGTAAELQANPKVEADAGTLGLTGGAAGLEASFNFDADPGVLILSGDAAALLTSFQVEAEAGSFILSGNAAALIASFGISAEPGSYALTGTDALLAANFFLGADSGAFTVSGTDVTFHTSYIIILDSGVFILTGTDVTFIVGELPDAPQINLDSYIAVTVAQSSYLSTSLIRDAYINSPVSADSYVMTSKSLDSYISTTIEQNSYVSF